MWINHLTWIFFFFFFFFSIHLIKKGNELLEKEIMAFYKELSSTVYNPPHISYKNMTSFTYNTDDFPSLPSNGTSHELTSVYIPIKP